MNVTFFAALGLDDPRERGSVEQFERTIARQFGSAWNFREWLESECRRWVKKKVAEYQHVLTGEPGE